MSCRARKGEVYNVENGEFTVVVGRVVYVSIIDYGGCYTTRFNYNVGCFTSAFVGYFCDFGYNVGCAYIASRVTINGIGSSDVVLTASSLFAGYVACKMDARFELRVGNKGVK